MRNLNNNSKKINYFRLAKKAMIAFVFGIFIGIGISKGNDILGFIGSIIGVIGAFILFRYQYEYTKSEESELSKDVIKNLLSYTIFETESIINYMIDVYIDSYFQSKGISKKDEDIQYKILKKKIKGENLGNSFTLSNGRKCSFTWRYNEKTFPHLIEQLGLSDLEFSLHESCLIIEKGKVDIIYTNNTRAIEIRRVIIEKFNKIDNFKNIVYIDNWIEYLYKISNNDLKYNRNILIWFNILKKTIKEIIEERKDIQKEIGEIKEQLKNIKDDAMFKTELEFLLNQNLSIKKIEEAKLKKDIISHICNFIYYRDEIINILRDYFKEDTLYTSTELLNKKFDEKAYSDVCE